MTKGKYAARAGNRREDSAIRSEIESYQHNVRRLTAESKELQDKLAALQQQHRDETRRLRAERDEGLSPETVALRKELAHQRERAAALEKRLRGTVDRQGKLIHYAAALLHEMTGCTGLEATEKIMSLIGDVDPAAMIADSETGANVAGLEKSGDADATRDRVRTLQRTRGWRSNTATTERLQSVAEAVRAAVDGP